MKNIHDLASEIKEGRLSLEQALKLIEGLRILEAHAWIETIGHAFLARAYDTNVACVLALSLIALGNYSKAETLLEEIIKRDGTLEIVTKVSGILKTAALLYPLEGKALLEQAAHEVATITGEPAQHILPLLKAEVLVKTEWEKLRPNEEDKVAVRKFYAQSVAYIFDLMYCSCQESTLFLLKTIGDHLKNLGAQSVLDYGGGAGTLSLYLHLQKFDTTHADLEGHLFEFARQRFQKRGVKVSCLSIEKIETESTSPRLDAVTCLEVFEHIPQPLNMVQTIHTLLKPGGWLVINESCLANEGYATHLASNRQYGGTHFIPAVSRLGFVHIPTAYEDWFKTFQKI